MILIFTETADLSTRNVLRYLADMEQQFEVFNETDLVEFQYSIRAGSSEYTVFKNNTKVCTDSQIKSVWYRRSDVRVKNPGNPRSEQESEYIRGHVQTRYENIVRCFHGKRCLGVFGKGNFNKIEFLDACTQLGIDIPDTLISDKKSDLKKFFRRCREQVITKSLSIPYQYQFEEDPSRWKIGYTTILKKEDVEALPDEFELSLFQEMLHKKFEVRVFYIDGRCFSQAIFSQMNEKSNLDYRQGYNTNMRCCTYRLPYRVELQVIRLMKTIGLNTGSLDLVVTTENRYVFLEVNPVGQFGAVSEITNYNLEYEIANYLKN